MTYCCNKVNETSDIDMTYCCNKINETCDP